MAYPEVLQVEVEHLHLVAALLDLKYKILSVHNTTKTVRIKKKVHGFATTSRTTSSLRCHDILWWTTYSSHRTTKTYMMQKITISVTITRLNCRRKVHSQIYVNGILSSMKNGIHFVVITKIQLKLKTGTSFQKFQFSKIKILIHKFIAKINLQTATSKPAVTKTSLQLFVFVVQTVDDTNRPEQKSVVVWRPLDQLHAPCHFLV